MVGRTYIAPDGTKGQHLLRSEPCKPCRPPVRFQYIAATFILEFGVQLPIVQDLNGTALENDYVVRAGFRVNF